MAPALNETADIQGDEAIRFEEVKQGKLKKDCDGEAKRSKKEEVELKRRLEEAEKEERRRRKEEQREAKRKQEEAKEEDRRKKKEELEAKRKQEEAEREEKRKKKEEDRKRKEDDRRKKEEERKRKEEEKEAKRLKDEADQEAKNKKRKETEEKEAQREEKRRRREESLKKQADSMAKFLKRKLPAGTDVSPAKPTNTEKVDSASAGGCLSSTPMDRRNALFLPPPENAAVVDARIARTAEIDKQLSIDFKTELATLLQDYRVTWEGARAQHKKRLTSRWGVRREAKVSVVKELRLQGQHPGLQSAGLAGGDSSGSKVTEKKEKPEGRMEKGESVDDQNEDLDEVEPDCQMTPEDSAQTNSMPQEGRPPKRRKLLQFKENHRPAFYGSESRKSAVVTPRQPLKKDPALDYEYNSDDDWEEEEPGESLSDTEKDDDKSDTGEDDEANDGFLVPDGYLSQDEGINNLDAEDEPEEGLEACSTDVRKDEVGGDSKATVKKLRQDDKATRILKRMIDRALGSNRPLLISALERPRKGSGEASQPVETNAESSGEKPSTGPTFGDPALLQALHVEVLTGHITIDVPAPPGEAGDGVQETKTEQRRTARSEKVLPEECLPELVHFLMESTQGMKKNVEVLVGKFPGVAKYQLETAIRRVADFTGGSWQVKSEVLKELGINPSLVPAATAMPAPPAKVAIPYVKPITTFFAKPSPLGAEQRKRRICPVEVLGDANRANHLTQSVPVAVSAMGPTTPQPPISGS